jgi:hypothetical protein
MLRQTAGQTLLPSPEKLDLYIGFREGAISIPVSHLTLVL